MNRDKYLKGLKWGKKISKDKKIYSNNYISYEKARSTCLMYAKDKRVKQTKHGEFLSAGDRDFYLGAYDALYLSKKRFM